jgi:GMP synthase (glutamine-hydrolysing)
MSIHKGHQTILILDFGSQYTQLIARRIRELGVYSEIQPYNTEFLQTKSNNIQGIILSGGPSSVYSENAPAISEEILDLNIPVLGICYAMEIKLYNCLLTIKRLPKQIIARMPLYNTPPNPYLVFNFIQRLNILLRVIFF